MADAPRTDALATRPMSRDPVDLDLFAACFAKNSTPRRREALEWQYLANPTKKLFVDFAMAPSNDRVAAVYATLPVHLRVGQHVTLGVQSVDTITDSDFRGRGLFIKLAKSTYARAAASGSRLVYGFPNGNSAHGFFERLEWTDLDPVPFLIRPLRSKYVLERLKLQRYAHRLPDVPLFFGRDRSDEAVVRVERFDERATSLWHSFAQRVGVAVERDAAYLNWRLVEKPGEDYRSEAVRAGDEFSALVTHVVKEKHGGRIGYVMEAICTRSHASDLRRLLKRALANMTRQGADVALAWCLPHSPQYTSYLRMGFLPFPERFRPIELHVGARDLASNDGIDVTDRRNWYFSYLDADTT
jgi:hypothetical protein